jgi:hypothetical protein
MYDTVKLYHPTAKPELKGVLDCLFERADPKTGDLWELGYLKNLRVRSNPQGLSIEGSLSKFKYGCNAFTTTRQATAEVVEELSDLLKFPCGEAQVRRIDVASTLLMQNPVIDYMSTLSSVPRCPRSDFHDRQTLSFKNYQKEIVVYDKVQQLIDKRQVVPEMFKGKNALRYEARFTSRLPAQFKKAIITAADLSEEVFYMETVKKWREQYFIIHKVAKERAFDMTGQKEYLRSLAFYGLKNIGVDVALDILRGEPQNSEADRKRVQRLKALTLEIAEAKPEGLNRSTAEECIYELDQKVRQAAACYR